MNDIDIIMLQGLTAILTALATWILSRKKYKVDVQKSELENVEKAVSIWRQMAEDFGKKVEDLMRECQDLQIQIEVLRRENKALKNAIKKFENRIKNVE